MARTWDIDSTIVALSSPHGPGLRAIVRMSGAGALAIAASLLDTAAAPARDVAGRRDILLPGGVRLASDILVMKSPATYTREDMVEFHLPSSHHLSDMLVRECVCRGARIATPGEFTLRAFLNGRIDLAQAEAVLNTIASSTPQELESAMELLDGGVSGGLRMVERGLIDLLADIEAAIDFVDQELEIVARDEISRRLELLEGGIADILDKVSNRTTRDDRIRLLLYGPANSGKSTLFNRLVPQGRAIVSGSAGTTRDLIEGECDIDGTSVVVVDSAGVDDKQQGADREAILKSHEALRSADIVLHLLDPMSGEENRPLPRLSSATVVVVVNKIDLCGYEMAIRAADRLELPSFIAISALMGTGMDDLRERISTEIETTFRMSATRKFSVGNQFYTALRRSQKLIAEASDDARNEAGLEILALNISEALASLGAVTGKSVSEEVLTTLFSRFCIGK